MGGASYQIQNGKPKLIAYASKRLKDTAKKLLHNRIRNVWFSYKYCKLFSLIKEGRF